MVRNSEAKWSAGTSECDGGVRSVTDMAQLVCCALALKNLRSVNLGLVEDYGARWSKVEQGGANWRSLEHRGKVQSNVEKSGAMWRSVGRYGEVWSNLEKSGANGGVRRNVEESGAVWESPEQHGGVQGDMERSGDAWSKCGERICVLFRLQTGVLP